MQILKMRTWMGLTVAAAAILMTGCEGDSSLGDGYDFGENDANVVVALGDSLTRGGFSGSGASYPAQLSAMIGKTVHNSGSSGEHSYEGATRVRSVLTRHRPGFLLILYGANDIVHGRSTESIIGNLRAIINAARDNQTIPVLGTLPPAYGLHDFMQGAIDGLNERIRQLAAEENVALAPVNAVFGDDPSLFLEDGLHPNEAGNTKLAEAFAAAF